MSPDDPAEGGRSARYTNPPVADGINASEEHPLREFLWLGSGALAGLAVIVICVAWLGHLLGAFVSIETEQRIAASLSQHLPAPTASETRHSLQALVDRLVAADPLPAGMTITVHLLEQPQVNAFATLGGHVVVLRGLLDVMPSENALAMVLAHEIAHVRERHVIRSLSRGVLTSLALGLLTGRSHDSLAESLAGKAGLGSALSFSRQQELEADALALRSVHALYGHVAGASSLFVTLQAQARTGPPEWFSSHPEPEKRIAALAAQARAQGWAQQGPLTALPAQALHFRPASP
jgi:beta-barrel assembly-enhancing protease